MNTALNKEQHAIQILNNPEKGNTSMRHSALVDILSEYCEPSKSDFEIFGNHEYDINKDFDEFSTMIVELSCFIGSVITALSKTKTEMKHSQVIDFVFDLLTKKLNYYIATELGSHLGFDFSTETKLEISFNESVSALRNI